jgi:hypothetical protein
METSEIIADSRNFGDGKFGELCGIGEFHFGYGVEGSIREYV